MMVSWITKMMFITNKFNVCANWLLSDTKLVNTKYNDNKFRRFNFINQSKLIFFDPLLIFQWICIGSGNKKFANVYVWVLQNLFKQKKYEHNFFIRVRPKKKIIRNTYTTKQSKFVHQEFLCIFICRKMWLSETISDGP